MEISETLFKRAEKNRAIIDVLSAGNSHYPQSATGHLEYDPAGVRSALLLLLLEKNDKKARLSDIDRLRPDLSYMAEKTNEIHKVFKIPVLFVPESDPRLKIEHLVMDNGVFIAKYRPESNLVEFYDEFKKYALAALKRRVLVLSIDMKLRGEMSAKDVSNAYNLSPSGTNIERFLEKHPGLSQMVIDRLRSEDETTNEIATQIKKHLEGGRRSPIEDFQNKLRDLQMQAREVIYEKFMKKDNDLLHQIN